MLVAISFKQFVLGDDKACFGSVVAVPRGVRVGSSSRRKVATSLSISAASNEVAVHETKDALKRALAKKAVEFVKSGMVVGLGTGSTASIAIEELGNLIKQRKLKDVAVGANYQSRVLARQYGVATVDLNDVNKIDIAIDGVDEVDMNKNLLKGGGGAHTMQKIVDTAARECIILADESKVVARLVAPVLRKLLTLGGVPEIRSALRKDGPVISDLGNMIVDVSFPGGIQNPAEMEKSIKLIPGVVENGIVTGIAARVLVGIQDGDDITVIDLAEFVKLMNSPADASL